MFKKQSEAVVPTKFGQYKMLTYSDQSDDYSPVVVLLSHDLDINNVVNVRIHSECMTGDVFGSARCECGEQLAFSMNYINEHQGVLIYLRQEGRGIGLINKLHAYQKQDMGYDTAEANTVLGLEEDSREYDEAMQVLTDLGISKINLLTNNPEKIKAFEDSGIELVDRVSVEIQPSDGNRKYLHTKKEHFGHYLKQV